jgi:hypothetical protein
MSRFRSNPVRGKAVLGALLLFVASGSAACDEEGKTAPERCLDPALPIFDIQAAGAPADDNAQYPCVTKAGHAVSEGRAPTASAGKAATSTAGKAASGDTAMAGAGAGGAP